MMDVNHVFNAPPHQPVPLEVEVLLKRFYHPETSNEEKQGIEVQLHNLQQTSFNWRFCITNMNRFDSQYLWFFAATTVESKINQGWEFLDEYEQFQLRQGLLDIYTNYPVDVPALQRDKVAQLIALAARRQCHIFHEFASHVPVLLDQKFILGLALTRAIGDSVTQSLNSINSLEQRAFHQVITSHASMLLRALNKYCAFFVVWLNGGVTDSAPGSIQPARCPQYSSELMHVLQQYFTWVELSNVDASMINNVAFISRRWDVNHDMAISAIAALCELQYRNQKLLPETNKQMLIAIYELLRQPRLTCADELYQDKVTEVLRLFIDRSWPYQNPSNDVPVDGILRHMLEFTVSSYGPNALAERLAIWSNIFRAHYDLVDGGEHSHWKHTVIKYAYELVAITMNKMMFRSNPDLASLDNEEVDENAETELQHFYHECIELIMKAIFMYPPALYDKVLDMVATDESCPYNQILPVFQVLNQLGQGNTYAMSVMPATQMQHRLRDFVANSYLMVRLSVFLYGTSDSLDRTIHRLTVGHIELFVQLSESAPVIAELFSRLAPVTPDLIAGVAQLLAALNKFLQLGPPRFDASALLKPSMARNMSIAPSHELKMQLLMQLPKYLVPQGCFTPQQWRPITSAVLNILFMIADYGMLGHQTCATVFDVLHQAGIPSSKLTHLDKATATMLRHVISHCLLDMGNGTSLDDSTQPKNDAPMLLEQYIQFLGHDLIEFEPARWNTMSRADQVATVASLSTEIDHITELMKFFALYSNTIRCRFSYIVQPLVEKVLNIFQRTINLTMLNEESATVAIVSSCSLVNGLLDFCHATVCCIQTQLGPRYVEDIVQLLHDMFCVEQMRGMQRLRSLTTLLNTFRHLVSHPHYMRLMPDIVRITIDDVMPVISARDRYTEKSDASRHVDACSSLYKLLHDMLHHRWQYFVESNVLLRAESAAAGVAVPRLLNQQEHFFAILNAYGYAILHCPTYSGVVRTVLASLEMLGYRRNLFALPFFSEHMLAQFMRSLLKLVLLETGSVYQEQVVPLLHAMARVNASKLNMTIFELGLCTDTQRLERLRDAMDLPTFRAQMDQLINDSRLSLRCHQP
ncbi:exportin-6-B [Anopheles nili]|uniref:exportin-6-B n=1 Tax=Anopheles nili TaxID=185578 RepID=UPI00237BD30B|nr:exportin-6-B [Anopheles nili]